MAQQQNLHRRRASADHGLQHQHKLRSSSPPVWDCGSTLFDSYELSSFTLHLQRAIAAAGPLPSSLSSPSILKDGRVRSLSMPHFDFTPSSQFTVVKEEEAMADVDFSSRSKIETLHQKTPSRVGVPKSVQRLFTRLAKQGRKSRTGAKQHDLHSKAGRTPFERILYTVVHYC